MEAASSEPVARANTLTTKRATARTFASTGSGQVVVPVVLGAVALRALLAAGRWPLSWVDLVMAVVVVVMTGPVEWVLHRHVLHAPVESFATRRLGLGLGHRQHHLDPPEMKWLMLRGIEMAIFLGILAVFTALWALPLAWALGGGLLGPLLTAFVFTAFAAGHYEWTHLLVHTAYRPRSRYYARLARNHRRHHYRNEHYWLGVTSNLGDRLMHTLPTTDDSVPRSETARTLTT
jgi:hypothetical protein